MESVDQSAENEPTPTLRIVKFWASWCGPCNLLQSNVWTRLKEKYATEVTFEEVNADKEPTVLSQHNVQGLPTVIFFKDGVEINRLIGLQRLAIYENLVEKNK